MTARTGRDPGELYVRIEQDFGPSFYERIDAAATAAQKAALKNLTPAQLAMTSLAGEPVTAVASHAPGNGAPIGGIKVSTKNGWFAARPSGTEDVYKIYAESFRDTDHLKRIQDEAQSVIARAITASTP
jgi:phosphoglucomutase